MIDSKENIRQVGICIVDFKPAMLICSLLLISIGMGVIVRSFYPQTMPLNYSELLDILPPIFFFMHITSQILSFITIFLAGYFIASYRNGRKLKRCQLG
ncbi:MAG: hypothetical protein ACFFB2_19845 [Promethearchaeota archaeon]